MSDSLKTGWYGTDYVARYILKIPSAKIIRALYAGKAPKPVKMWGTAFCWTIAEIETLAAAIGKEKEVAAFRKLPIAEPPKGANLAQ